MKRDEALALVREFTRNENLVRHMLAVEAGMRSYARRFGEDEESWGRVGLLHDFDWEIHPTLDEHPVKGVPILRERGVDEEDIRTILSHGYETGVPRETLRDKALYAVDELTGLVRQGSARNNVETGDAFPPSQGGFLISTRPPGRKGSSHALSGGGISRVTARPTTRV